MCASRVMSCFSTFASLPCQLCMDHFHTWHQCCLFQEALLDFSQFFFELPGGSFCTSVWILLSAAFPLSCPKIPEWATLSSAMPSPWSAGIGWVEGSLWLGLSSLLLPPPSLPLIGSHPCHQLPQPSQVTLPLLSC